MNCPRCSQSLRSVSVKGVTLDICEACDGIWLDNNELSTILKFTYDDFNNSPISSTLTADKNILSNGTQSEIFCPTCRIPMKTYTYCGDSKVRLDRCSSCNGIWIDDGELKGIIDYLKMSSEPLPPEKISAIQSKLVQIENETNMMEQEMLDDLVKSDYGSSIFKVPGKMLQAVYNFFYKMGL